MLYKKLRSFLERDMRMSHIYQPVMLRKLLSSKGRASITEIARALLNQDRSQIEYYSEITKTMVGRVLAKRGLVRRDGDTYELMEFDSLTPAQVKLLAGLCDAKAAEYIASRGEGIWDHRRRSTGYISGTLRYDVLKAARFRCELCGISADDSALQVDHIMPRNKGGSDDPSNLQALCYTCNAMKRDRDDTDLRAVRASYEIREEGCPFCDPSGRAIVLENPLAVVLRDKYPVTPNHLLAVPRRHVADYFALGSAELRACHDLVSQARALVLQADSSVSGFNVGVNEGTSAGQTVLHCHIHLIPRRHGDTPNPRGGVRAVVPDMADY